MIDRLAENYQSAANNTQPDPTTLARAPAPTTSSVPWLEVGEQSMSFDNQAAEIEQPIASSVSTSTRPSSAAANEMTLSPALTIAATSVETTIGCGASAQFLPVRQLDNSPDRFTDASGSIVGALSALYAQQQELARGLAQCMESIRVLMRHQQEHYATHAAATSNHCRATLSDAMHAVMRRQTERLHLASTVQESGNIIISTHRPPSPAVGQENLAAS